MAVDDTKLSHADKDKIAAYLNKFGTPPKCPISGSRNWVIADHLVAPIVTSKAGALNIGGTSYPLIMLVSEAGYTMFINAVVAGIVVSTSAPATGAK